CPAATTTPVVRSAFGQSRAEINQSDIVMLLTPHVVRTHELTAEDLAPIYIGTQQNIGLGGPPPLIAPVPSDGAAGSPAGGGTTAAPGTAPANPLAPGANRPTLG